MKPFYLYNRCASRLRRIVAGVMLLLALAMSADTHASAASIAVEPVVQFDHANKLYEQGRFADAASAYESIRQSGLASSPLYFNLGNARFKSAQLGHAIAAYRAAEQLTPRDPDVRANLQFARNQVQGPSYRAGRTEKWLQTLSVNEWTGLCLATLWLTCAMLIVAQLRPKVASAMRNLTISGAIITGMLTICLVKVLSHETGENIAVVTVREATVRNGPLEESPGAFTAHDGAEMRVLDKMEDWIQVTDGKRRVGWMKRADVTLPDHS